MGGLQGWLRSHRGYFTRFTLVGTAGFIVDAGILSATYRLLGWDPLVGRALSFSGAVSITWFLNRRYTFPSASGSRRAPHQYSRYFGVQITGALLNFLVYAGLLATIPRTVLPPEIALAAGASLALLWNYFGSRRFVFR